ncbi:helix-turn-helix transcriptional regulator [Streptomyces sp. NPDC057638]|uniref:helix-turn-helix transcriptional regulator n=1 Tax=Streptomyces sp. NPDC057638 TaxID=3346190 RepID=UPI003693EB3A
MPHSSPPPVPDISPDGDPLLSSGWHTTEELAALLRVDPSTLRRWRTARPHQGPPHVPLTDRVTLYSAADVERWLRQRRIAPGTGA